MKASEESYRGIKVGDLVCVRDDVTGYISEPVKVVGRYIDVEGGLILEEEAFGFRMWNAECCLRVCPKCAAISGDDWAQCGGSCPMEMSPHYKPADQVADV